MVAVPAEDQAAAVTEETMISKLDWTVYGDKTTRDIDAGHLYMIIRKEFKGSRGVVWMYGWMGPRHFFCERELLF